MGRVATTTAVFLFFRNVFFYFVTTDWISNDRLM